VLRGLHGGQRAQPEGADAAARRVLHDRAQQLPADTLALLPRVHRERPDVRLSRVARELAVRAERLQGDRTDDPPGTVLGDEHRAVAAEPEPAQRVGVTGGLGQQPVRPVRRHAQLANQRVLVGTRFPDHHLPHATRPVLVTLACGGPLPAAHAGRVKR
jgi:hypothetical protein